MCSVCGCGSVETNESLLAGAPGVNTHNYQENGGHHHGMTTHMDTRTNIQEKREF